MENLARRATSGKRKAESGKRKAESGKRKAESGKRKAESGRTPLPASVAGEIDAYFRCGILDHGFTLLSCDDCEAKGIPGPASITVSRIVAIVSEELSAVVVAVRESATHQVPA